MREDQALLESHRDMLAPIAGDESARLEPGGYSLKTDFGIGSVSRS